MQAAEETKEPLKQQDFISQSEARDIRVAKRNVDSFSRFLELSKSQLDNLASTDGPFTLYEVLDLMRNHIDD